MLLGKDLAEGVTGCLNQRMDVLPWISWYLFLTPEPLSDLSGALCFAVPGCPQTPWQREASSS